MNTISLKKKKNLQGRDITQQLKALGVLLEEPGKIPSIHAAAQTIYL